MRLNVLLFSWVLAAVSGSTHGFHEPFEQDSHAAKDETRSILSRSAAANEPHGGDGAASNGHLQRTKSAPLALVAPHVQRAQSIPPELEGFGLRRPLRQKSAPTVKHLKEPATPLQRTKSGTAAPSTKPVRIWAHSIPNATAVIAAARPPPSLGDYAPPSLYVAW